MKKLSIIIPIIILIIVSTVALFRITSGKMGHVENWRLLLIILGYIILVITALIFLKKLSFK
ncbi:hypothetical protein [Chryseobacterium sp. CT-SW4]|uniref:hypothetical protein n=1 Tax=Chryseobacterium sp. SW-1 TaxID=3157343 RepID=UPI003B019005